MHEQRGTRPAVVVGVPSGKTRYPLIVVVPLTTQIGGWALENPKVYPVLHEGIGNLAKASVVLLDQIRGVDARRVGKYLGTLSEQQYRVISEGITQVLT